MGLVNPAICKLLTHFLQLCMRYIHEDDQHTSKGTIIHFIKEIKLRLQQIDCLFDSLYKTTLHLPMRFYIPDTDALLKNCKTMSPSDFLSHSVVFVRQCQKYMSIYDIVFKLSTCKTIENELLSTMNSSLVFFVLSILPDRYRKKEILHHGHADIVIDMVFLPQIRNIDALYGKKSKNQT